MTVTTVIVRQNWNLFRWAIINELNASLFFQKSPIYFKISQFYVVFVLTSLSIRRCVVASLLLLTIFHFMLAFDYIASTRNDWAKERMSRTTQTNPPPAIAGILLASFVVIGLNSNFSCVSLRLRKMHVSSTNSQKQQRRLWISLAEDWELVYCADYSGAFPCDSTRQQTNSILPTTPVQPANTAKVRCASKWAYITIVDCHCSQSISNTFLCSSVACPTQTHKWTGEWKRGEKTSEKKHENEAMSTLFVKYTWNNSQALLCGL